MGATDSQKERRVTCSEDSFRMRQRFPQLYFRLFRFSTEHFDSLLSLLRPFITKHDTAFRQAVPADM